MIQVTIKTNTTRDICNTDVNSTPASLFEAKEIAPSGVINLNGIILSATDLQATFSALGIADGAKCTLSSIVKLDGANLR